MRDGLAQASDSGDAISLFDLLAEFDRCTSCLSFDQVLKGALGFISQRLRIGRASIALLTPAQDGLRMFDATCDVKGVESGQWIPLDSATLGATVGQKTAIYRPDLTARPLTNAVDEALVAHGFKSTYSAPILAFGRCCGTINLADQAVDGIDGDIRRFLELAAPRLGFALETALAMDALSQSEMRFRDVFETVGDGIAVAEISTQQIVLVNAAMCELLGRTKAELLASRIDVAHPAEHMKEVERIFDMMARGELDQWLEVPMKRGDGDPFLADVTARLTTLEGKRCLVGVFRDAASRRQREDEQILAKKLDSIRTLAAGIAHDFNNLLTGVLGNVSLAQELLDGTNEVRELLAQAEHAAMRATSLTRQLLTFAKGGAPLRDRVNVARVLRDSANVSVACADVSCSFDFVSEDVTVIGDEGQLAQVFQNVLRNAVEAMPNGGHVHLGLHRRSHGATEEVVAEITDEGTGMEPELLDKIFVPFFSTKAKGSGLGLAVAYSIVQNHGGRIEVTTAPGRGATFRLCLPFAGRSETNAPNVTLRSRGEGRVLVMDDESVVRQVAEHALLRAGFAPVMVANGADAVAVYREAFARDRRFDVVVLDLTIPSGMGGREAAKRILDIDPSARLIVSSGYSDDSVMAKYREHGFSAVLPKPFGARQLCEVVENLLTLSGMVHTN
ncbi:MAG: ATP-binding protein [Polyangiaceae bacterium]